jgi:hypothetical protein
MEAEMPNHRFRWQRMKLAVIVGVGLGSITVTGPAFAQYRHQVAQICQDKVNAKGLKGDNRK